MDERQIREIVQNTISQRNAEKKQMTLERAEKLADAVMAEAKHTLPIK